MKQQIYSRHQRKGQRTTATCIYDRSIDSATALTISRYKVYLFQTTNVFKYLKQNILNNVEVKIKSLHVGLTSPSCLLQPLTTGFVLMCPHGSTNYGSRQK